MRPFLSLALLLTWLMLNHSFTLTDVLIGLVLAISIPYFSRDLLNTQTAIRRPLTIIRLSAYVLWDIIRSALQVCVAIISPKPTNSVFIQVPLQLRNQQGLAVLSAIINCTPGTVWVEILPDSHILNLHVFDLKDKKALIDSIKQRLEAPLITIFETP